MQFFIASVQLVAPVLVAVLFIAGCSLLEEPNRRNFSAIMMAGAGAAYLGGSFGVWEIVFCVGITYLAYRGLRDYRFLGVAWLLHTCWDVAHFLYGRPIIPFLPNSSGGCAICDVVLAAWFFRGAPTVLGGNGAHAQRATRATSAITAERRVRQSN